MDYQITVRFGSRIQRYLTLAVSAQDAAEAMVLASQNIPPEVVPEVDLVELRVAPDFEKTFPDQSPPDDPLPDGPPEEG